MISIHNLHLEMICRQKRVGAVGSELCQGALVPLDIVGSSCMWVPKKVQEVVGEGLLVMLVMPASNL